MDVIKIIGIGIISLLFIIIIKQYKPEFSVYISLIGGIIIFCLIADKLTAVINLLTSLSNKASINSNFLGLLLKITGISILTEYAASICKDSGEAAIANKIDFGAKILIIAISIPIISTLLEMINKII